VTATVTPPTTPTDGAPRRTSPWRFVILAVVVLFAAFWIWALFFASKESVNKIGDTAWAARAQRICEAAQAERMQLADLRRVDPNEPGMLAERGDIVDKATDIVERMLADVVAVTPRDAKGQALVPLWERDYRTYLEDRREFADDLRAGKNEPFAETAVDGIPISEKITVFAGDNRMPDCAPPTDLA
jgi:hypothetical protein